jgi:hypothetical protein
VTSVTISPDWGSPRVAQVFGQVTVAASGGDPNPGEADMGRHHHTITAALWMVVSIVAVIFLGDALTLLAVALAVVTAAWWAARELEHRLNSYRASHSRRPLVGMVGDSAGRTAAVDLRHRPHHRTVGGRAIPVG